MKLKKQILYSQWMDVFRHYNCFNVILLLINDLFLSFSKRKGMFSENGNKITHSSEQTKNESISQMSFNFLLFIHSWTAEAIPGLHN